MNIQIPARFNRTLIALAVAGALVTGCASVRRSPPGLRKCATSSRPFNPIRIWPTVRRSDERR